MGDFGIFNIGFGELFFILILAGLVLGPQRIRQVALYLGKLTARLQGIARGFRNQLYAELDASDVEEMKAMASDFRELQREVQELKQELVRGPRELRKEASTSIQESRDLLNGSKPIENRIGPVDYHPPDPDKVTIPSEVRNAVPKPLPTVVDVADDPD